MERTEFQRAWAKREATKIHSSPEAKSILAIELGQEFGRRVGMAEREGIPLPIAFEACRENFRVAGEMMIAIANEITLEMTGLGKKK